MKTHYDVIVSGGEPAGIAATVQAARMGADTLLLEKKFICRRVCSIRAFLFELFQPQ